MRTPLKNQKKRVIILSGQNPLFFVGIFFVKLKDFALFSRFNVLTLMGGRFCGTCLSEEWAHRLLWIPPLPVRFSRPAAVAAVVMVTVVVMIWRNMSGVGVGAWMGGG